MEILLFALHGSPGLARSEPEPDAAAGQGRLGGTLLAGILAVLTALAAHRLVDPTWVGALWAAEAWALVWLASRLAMPGLRVYAAVLAALVGARLLLNPAMLDYPLGPDPLQAWWLHGIGIPIVAFTAAAINAELQRAGRLARGLVALTMALVLGFLVLQIRQTFSPGRLDAELGWLEAACHALSWLMAAWIAARLAGLLRRWRVAPTLLWGYRAMLVAGVAGGALLVGLALGPWRTAVPVGSTPILNHLLWAYGAPVLVLSGIAKLLDRHARRGLPGRQMAVFARLAALLTLGLLVTLQVRQLFHGPILSHGSVELPEAVVYALVWLVAAPISMGWVRSRGEPGPGADDADHPTPVTGRGLA